MRNRPVEIWLAGVFLLICAMVLIGGTTRLTGSGLSMVEWRPLMGFLPPLDHDAWQAVFDKYKESPQYSQVNHWMVLDDFKRIFFWEYFHRLLGRVIGVAFMVPWIFFVVRGRLRGWLARRTALAFVFGGAQGLLGWLMVKSGLVDIPAVSHYRLAAHLMLALFVALWILWILLDMRLADEGARQPSPRSSRVRWAVVGLIAIQCVYGAFMAGTRAGYLSDTFPKMNGVWIPADLGSLNPFAHPTAIHFIHRVLAWVTAASVLVLSWKCFQGGATRRQAAVALWLALAVLLQFLLGVLTVVLEMPVAVAVAHQGGAIVLLSAAVANAHPWVRGRIQESALNQTT